ncbi:MAG: hypothetical protein ACHRHE_23045 [Tepidisphaerales bacterium]
MIRTISIALITFLSLAPLARAADSTPVPWEEQLRAMGYFIMHLSSINAINGINLTRQQAVDLRVMALDIEKSASRLPPLVGRYRPDLGEVRDTYLEVEKLLLAGQEIPDALEARVGKARGYESAVIRQSLVNPVAGSTTCLKCHGQPAQGDLRSGMLSGSPLNDAVKHPSQLEVFLAHHVGLFGIGGSLKMLGYIDKIDKLLKPEQKQALTGFSCCLTPPKSMSDPVRAGQASGGEKEIDFFRAIRKMNDVQWEITKAVGSGWIDKAVVAKSPGAKPEEIVATRAKAIALLEKIRKVPDSDFELDKGKLAAELRQIAGVSSGEQAEKDRKFGTATFLLVPGSADAYTALIKRLDQHK